MRFTFRKNSSVRYLFLSLAISAAAWGANDAPNAKPKHTAHHQENSLATHLQQLEEQITRQQSLINQQQDRIERLEQQVQQSNSRHQQSEESLHSAVLHTTDQAAELEKTTSTLNSSLLALKSSISTTAEVQRQEEQRLWKNLEQPETIRFKGLSLTPGGFIEADMLSRSRNENADVCSSLAGIPFDGVANAKLSEFRATSRATRFTLFTESKINNTRLNGYYELDFLAQAPTGNQVQTNSFIPRQRQLWIQLSFPNNLTLTAGQYWSLITTNRKGLATRTEFIPSTIEGSYVVGYDYVRQTALRITKNFHDKIWTGFEAANSETNQPNASYVPDNLFGFNNSANAASPSGGTLNYLAGSTNGFSTNLAPDLLAKTVWEPGWGHYEIKALGRFFRDRLNGQNNYSYGGGLGAAAILPVVRQKADFILEGLAGSGIGRYGAANGSDITLRPDGKIIPLRALHALAGVEIHPTSRIDIFTYGGEEYYDRTPYINPTNAGKPAGYGSRLVNNTYCNVEVVPSGGAACGAQNKNIWHATTGLWYRFYKGPGGTFQYGLQYEYLHRATWSGIGGAPGGYDSVFMTSARYILP